MHDFPEPFAGGGSTRLDDAVQDELLARAARRELLPGDSLFLKGSYPDALFGVTRGKLRVSVAGPTGREAVITVLEPGQWFGEVSLFIGRERVYDVVALAPSEVAVVGAPDFHQLVAQRPDVHMAFTRLVCHRLRQALAWIDDSILMPLDARLAHRLGLLRNEAEAGSQTLHVSQDDLAAMLGISRQSVNRQLKLWEADGLLRLRYRSVDVLDWERLDALGRMPGTEPAR